MKIDRDFFRELECLLLTVKAGSYLEYTVSENVLRCWVAKINKHLIRCYK